MKVAAAADAAKRDIELRAQFVVVPPGDEAKTIACPICKEPLKSEFQEDDEEWVWKNAVNVDGRVRCFISFFIPLIQSRYFRDADFHLVGRVLAL